MATRKKAAPKRKSVVKSAPKARSTKTRKSSKAELRSFKPARSTTPFMTFKPSIQTLYWIIILAAVTALALWVIHLQDEVNKIYDQIDANTYQLEMYPDTPVDHSAKKK